MGDVHFFRYTDLPSLIHILKNRQLTLLDPMSWDDKNDSSFVTLYREKCDITSVLALCFTRASETYHHWRIFSPGPSGVRITFNESLLRSCIDAVEGLQLTEIEYVKLNEFRSKDIDRNRLPFLKRHPFQHEGEVRLLWQSKTEERSSIAVPIDLSAISQITLSPWLHTSLVDSVKSMLKSIDGCGSIKVHRTTLVSNAEWLKLGATAT